MKSCPYCAQTDTVKDQHGYCKKHNCFERSGAKAKLNNLKKELEKARRMPTCVRNSFDGSYYNPREIEVTFLNKKITELMGYVPLECL